MSRSTIINEMSNSVWGAFPLYDLLSISTLSGSIDITVLPQPASSAKAPAELRLNTASGSIKVTMAPFLDDPSTVLPERTFSSSLKSMSGSITAALVHNHKTSLSTMSGDIIASLYPLDPASSHSHANVHNMSGSTSLTLHPHIKHPQSILKTLSADFHGASGNLKIRFPCTWEGNIISNLSSGRFRYQWEGLRVLNDGLNFSARSGNGSGQLVIRGSSMSVQLVGERVLGLPRQVEVRDEGERVPDSQRGGKGVKEVAEDQEVDDDWTVVGDEDGDPPSYEDATRR